MSSLSIHFSDEEIQPIKSGIRTFIRLTGLIHDEFQHRWFADEADAISFLDSIKRAFRLSDRMQSKMKYQNQPFDFLRQIREDLQAVMLTGRDEMSTVANRKRYSPLYYLVIEPVINLFSKFDHATSLELVDAIVDDVMIMVHGCTDYGTYDDAMVAQAITRNVIAQREEAAKILKNSRRRGKKKQKEEDFFEPDADVESVETTEETT